MLPSSDEVPVLQREVQRMLGRCLWKFQQYERLLKAIVAQHEVVGPIGGGEAAGKKRADEISGKTMGTLIGVLFDRYFESDSRENPVVDTRSISQPSVSMRFGETLSKEDLDLTERQLRDFVTLRNELVHHFIEQHDLWSVEGCRAACKALEAATEQIDGHLADLKGLAERLQQTQRAMSEFLQSDGVKDLLVNGIRPDGSVDWSFSGIESVLRKAFEEVAVEGWADVEQAAAWIGEHDPDQTPQKYGCRSWGQAIQETRAFEHRRFPSEGSEVARYRPRD